MSAALASSLALLDRSQPLPILARASVASLCCSSLGRTAAELVAPSRGWSHICSTISV